MGDIWLKLKQKQTIKTRIVIEDGWKHKETIYERCRLCYATECELYGRYGTDNSFGSFCGICKECLEKIKAME